jgi:2'-5' RNA ligase
MKMMKTMKTWTQFLDEKLNQEHDFSSTQIDLPKSLATEIIIWGRKNIPNSFLYTKEDHGREDEIHVTVLYGLKDEHPDRIKEILEPQRPVKFKLGRVSAFDSDNEYDVIKIDVNSPDLHKLHKLLKILPHEESHPRYQPHVTIAYVKKGKGKKIIGDGTFDGEVIDSKKVIFSSYNGNKTEIELKK